MAFVQSLHGPVGAGLRASLLMMKSIKKVHLNQDTEMALIARATWVDGDVVIVEADIGAIGDGRAGSGAVGKLLVFGGG